MRRKLQKTVKKTWKSVIELQLNKGGERDNRLPERFQHCQKKIGGEKIKLESYCNS